MKIAVIVFPMMLAGCAATTTAFVPYGKDSYMVSSEDFWGVQSSGSLQIKAAQKASEFCAEKGKKFVVRNTTGQAGGFAASSATLLFSCVSENESNK